MPKNSPIIACSSGNDTNTAISVIRCSGFSNLNSLNIFFKKDLSLIGPRKCYLTEIIDGTTTIDSAMIIFFKGPNSYTGENVLEISVHGNKLNVYRILELFTKNNTFRLAMPGEFTYRAYLNKKLSVSQIEGLDLFLNAKTPLVLNQGIMALQGEIHKNYLKLYSAFVDLKAALELSIDFVEDIGEKAAKDELSIKFDQFAGLIEWLNQRTKTEVSSLLSPTIILLGQTNAGKSSLFNRLLKMRRAIVTEIHGTTTDYISEYISIKDTDFRLIDTAGIRSTKNKVEHIGISQTFKLIENAFYKILIVNPFETKSDEFTKIEDVEFDLLVVTHADKEGFIDKFQSLTGVPKYKSAVYMDLSEVSIASGSIGPKNVKSGPIEPKKISVGPIEPKTLKNGPIGPDLKNSGPIEPVQKSCGPIGPNLKNGGPIEPEKIFNGPIGPKQVKEEVLLSFIEKKYSQICEQNPILIGRQRQAIKQIYFQTKKLKDVLHTENDVAIISSELNILQSKIEELIGIVSADDVLNSIFDNFCIGK
ncbi:MAG: 50S ribosome-binding GTPase [Bacteriovoracaceae bacterium]|nr:50S ribosome-binding GTPase [Bacteriovoracaceae bacterium]